MRAFLLITLAALMALSCHESLPTRTEPSKVFEADIRMRYVYNRFNNQLRFDVTVFNVFDETLDDSAGAFAGSLTLWVARWPEHSKTIPITVRDIELSPSYDAVRKRLILDPGDSLFMQFTWDLIAADGTSLKDSVFTYGPDPTCDYRVVAERELADARLDLVVFERVQGLTSHSSTPFCFYNTWVETARCPLPNVLQNGCPHAN